MKKVIDNKKMKTQNKKEGWVKGLIKLDEGQYTDFDKIESFIRSLLRSLLHEREEEMVKKAKGLKKTHKCKAELGRCDGMGCCENGEGMNGWERDGFNAALDEVINKVIKQ